MRREGFTLIEVLIALAIVSAVIAALYSTFFLSHRAIEAIDDSLVRIQESRNVMDVLKREAESTFYERGKTYALFKLEDKDFYGKQASRLTFTSFSALLPGLSKITYSVDEDNGKMILKKKVISAYARSGRAKDVELIEDIEAFTIEAKYNGSWVKTWDSELTNSMPEEIRITVKIMKRDKEGKSGTPFTITENMRTRIGKAI